MGTKVTHKDYPICVKILLYKGISPDRVVYYKNKLPMFVVEKWKWYFEYLAARIKVKHPRTKVELIICAQHLLQGEEYKQKKIQDMIKANRAKLTRLQKEAVTEDLFNLSRTDHDEKIKLIQARIESLERGEFNGYVPTTYINDVKEYI